MDRRWPDEKTASSVRQVLKKVDGGGAGESELMTGTSWCQNCYGVRQSRGDGRRKMGALRHFSASAVAREES